MLLLEKKDRYILIVIYLAFLLFNLQIFRTYFLQDEWNGVGRNLYLIGEGGGAVIKDIFTFRGFLHFNPATRIYSVLNTLIWGSSSLGFSLWVFLLALLNIYVLIKYLNLFFEKNYVVKTLTLLFFLFSHISYQSYYWAAQSFSIQGSFIFINLSFIVFIYFLRNDKRSYLFLSLFLFLFSTFFKETGIGLLLLFPITYLLFKSDNFSFHYLIGALRVLFVFGVSSIIIFVAPRIMSVNAENVVSSSLNTSFPQILYNLTTIPVKSLSHVFVQNPKAFYILSQFYLNFEHGINSSETFGNRYDFLTYYVATSTISYIVSTTMVVFILMFLYLLYRSKNFLHFKIVIWCLGYFYLSLVPFSFQNFHNIFLDSRYYYMPVLPFSLIFSLGIYHFSVVIKSYFKQRKLFLLGYFLYSLGIIAYIGLNIYSNYITLKSISTSTAARRGVLNFMSGAFSIDYGQGVILYVEDINHPNKDLVNITGSRFQTGLLYPFLVYSYSSGKIPHTVFKDDTFWDMGFQGYRSFEGVKFGIYYDKIALIKDLKSGNIDIGSIYSITFDYSGLKDCPDIKSAVEEILCVSYTDSTEKNRKIFASSVD